MFSFFLLFFDALNTHCSRDLEESRQHKEIKIPASLKLHSSGGVERWVNKEERTMTGGEGDLSQILWSEKASPRR